MSMKYVSKIWNDYFGILIRFIWQENIHIKIDVGI